MNKIIIFFSYLLAVSALFAAGDFNGESATSELGISIRGQSETWIVVDAGKTMEYAWFDQRYGVIRHTREIKAGEADYF